MEQYFDIYIEFFQVLDLNMFFLLLRVSLLNIPFSTDAF